MFQSLSLVPSVTNPLFTFLVSLQVLDIFTMYIALWILSHIYVGLYNIMSDYISAVTNTAMLPVAFYILMVLALSPMALYQIFEVLPFQISLHPTSYSPKVAGDRLWWIAKNSPWMDKDLHKGFYHLKLHLIPESRFIVPKLKVSS
jgi:CybS, succinate dehydrogenase cytochrome B small subunit